MMAMTIARASRQRKLNAFAGGEDRTEIANRRQRQPQIGGQPDRRHRKRDDKKQRLGTNHSEEHLWIADFAEPKPVCIKTDGRRTRKEGERQQDEDDKPNRSMHGQA
jgi:hypothetical protein